MGDVSDRNMPKPKNISAYVNVSHGSGQRMTSKVNDSCAKHRQLTCFLSGGQNCEFWVPVGVTFIIDSI